MEILLLILGLGLFVGLVIVHEFGHFIVARRNGVQVEEFGLGLPPRLMIIKTDKQGTKFTLNALPLGGFVKLKGEHDGDKGKQEFGSTSFWSKTKIILAGVLMNLITAWVMFTILAFIGIPKLPLPGGTEQFTISSDTRVVSNKVLVGYVEPNGPADKAGIKPGDRIEYITDCQNCLDIFTDREIISDAQDLHVTAQANAGTTQYIYTNRGVSQVELRTAEEVEASTKTDNPKGYMGVIPYDYTVQRSTWSAPIVGVGLIGQFSKLTYSALGSTITSLFKGHGSEASQNVSGPVGIFVVLRDGASLGVNYILLIVALLSLTLAIMNTLPIPALDGGKLTVMAIFRIFKRELKPKTEEFIHGTGYIALLLLFVLITVVDVRRFF